MARDITVTFDDGSSHVYENAPDSISFDQALERAKTDFSDRGITHIDGGRKTPRKADLSALPTGTAGVSMGEAEAEPTSPAPTGKSIFERGVKMEPPTVDYEKNLETMRRSGSPESIMFTPGRQREAVEQQIMRGQTRQQKAQEAAAAKAAEQATTRDFLLKRQAEAEGYGFGSAAQDIAGALEKGVVGLGQAGVGLAQLATGWIPEDPNINPLQLGQWGKMLDKLGYDPEATNRFLTGLQSPQMQLQLEEVEKTKGFFNTLGALAVNPLALLNSIVESLPGTIGAGAAGGQFVRYLGGKAAAEAETLGLKGLAAQKYVTDKVKEKAAQIAGAASAAEGAQTAGSIADQARAAGRDWDEYVAPALAAGLGTAAIGAVSGKIATNLGIGDIETEIAARSAGIKGVGVGANQSFLRNVRNEMVKEGIFEELPQGTQEQIFTNLATGRPWNEGVPEAAAQSLAAGVGMGGGHAVLARALGRTGEIVNEQATKLADSIARKGLPMTTEELARSKGFLRTKKTADELINDLSTIGDEDKLEAERADADRLEAEREAAAERAAIQNVTPITTTEEEGPEPPDIFAPRPAAEKAAEKIEAAPAVEPEKPKPAIQVSRYNDGTFGLDWLDRGGRPALERTFPTEQAARTAAEANFPGEPIQEGVYNRETKQTEIALQTPTEEVTVPSKAPSTALVPVSGEIAKQIKSENPSNGIDIDDWVDTDSPTGLWEGGSYYAGTPNKYGGPTDLVPITNLEEAKNAEANGKAIYALSKPEQQTVPELEKQIATLKGERNKLLSPTGREPKPGTKKRAQWDQLTRKMDDLWGQITAIESGRVAPEAPLQLTNEPFTIEGEVRVINETKTKDEFGNSVTQIEFSNGATYEIQRMNSAESMGLPGWHDANATTTTSFIANTKEEAIKELVRRETEKQKAPLQLTNEPFTIDVEARVVSDAVNSALSPLELQKLTAHYGASSNSEKFLSRVKEDIVRFANEGASAVASNIRDIIKKLHAAVLSAAIIFNPTNASVPEFIAYPTQTVTYQEQIYADLPAGTEEMSEGGKQAYRTLYPVVKDRIERDNKLFTVVDKPTSHTYIFGPDGKIILRTKTLLGKAYGDFYKGNNDLPQNRITPAGFFTFGLRDATRSPGEARTAGDYDFKKVFVLDKVISGEYSVTMFHSVWLNETDAAMRARAIASEDQTDSRYSFGCVNVNKQTFGYLVNNHLQQMDGSPLFIVPDDPANLATMLSGKQENRDGLERNTFTPPTKDVVEEIPPLQDEPAPDPQQLASMEGDRRRDIFKSIVEVATTAATSIPIDIADFVKTNMAGVAQLVKLFQDGKLSAEDFAGQMLRFQERVAQQTLIKRNQINQRMRGFGRVVKALEDAKKAGRISPETADFAIWFLSKNPAMASNLGIKIAIPENKKVQAEMAGTAGFYVPFEELVRILTSKDAKTGQYYGTKADVAVHEILHHLERMLPDDVRRAIRKEWGKQIAAELKKAKAENDTNKVNYLTLILVANSTGSSAAYKAAEEMLTSGEVPINLYALFNPSEFWAVRGSGLLAGRYGAGTRFAKVKQWMREFVQALKSIFGMQSDHPIIQGLEAVIRGDGTFVTNELLREGIYEVPAKQVTPKGLHPDVAAAINRNDISGALRALAQNTSGLYSVLASRLAELNLPTSIAFDNARELIRQSIDLKTADAQVQLFTYVRRAFPDVYNKYFTNYDKPESLEKVYEGLKVLESSKYDTTPLQMQLAAVRASYDENMPGLKRSGMFVPSLDAISLNSKGPFGLKNRVLLHEVVHAATEYMIRNTRLLNDRQREAVTDLYTMFYYAKDKLGGTYYGFTDIYEFVAEALTNPDFQNKLRGVPYKAVRSSIFNGFIRFVMKLFGSGNVASAAMKQANEIFSAERSEDMKRGPLRFAPPKRMRYKRGPLTSTWRAAEDVMVKFSDMLKASITSFPEADKFYANLRRSAGYMARIPHLPVLGLTMMKGEVERSIPFLGTAISISNNMTSYRGRMMHEASTILNKWAEMQRRRPEQSRLMSAIMLEATIQGTEVDPLGPGYVNPATAKPNEKIAHPKLEAAWNGLDGDFQQLYREVRNYYTDLLKATIREMKLRVLNSGKTSAEKKALIRKIDMQFGMESFNRPYFPLRRFGDFWFQVTSNGFSEFYTFESHLERDAAYDKRYEQLMAGNVKQQEAAASMKAGNQISTMYSDNKDVAGALKDVNELIDAISDTVTEIKGGIPYTRDKTADEVKSEVRGSVEQLIYILLPQQSMRKMFINRRAVQGASSDMLRVFAETATRAAYQQSRFKFVQPFLNNMANAHDYIRKYIPGKRQTVLLDYINELEKRYRYMFGIEDKSGFAKFAGGASQFMFLVNLAAPASALMNIIAFPIMAERTIGGKYGVVKSNKVIAKYFGRYLATAPTRTMAPLAKRDFAQIKWPSIVEGAPLTGALGRAAKRFTDDGDIHISQTNDAFDFAERPSNLYARNWAYITQAVFAPFHQMDRLTREVTLMSVFELAYDKYLGAEKRDARGVIQRDPNGVPLTYTEPEAFEKAIEEARDAAALSLGEYLRQLKGRVFANPAGALVLQMKQVAVTITYAIFRDMWLAFGAPLTSSERKEFIAYLEDRYKTDPNKTALIERDLKEYTDFQKEIYKEAFRKVVLINATAFVMAGAEGTPIYFLVSILPAVASLFAPDDENLESFEVWFYNMLMRDFSGAVTELAMQAGMSEEAAETLGIKAAHATARGLFSTLTNWSVSERIGINPQEMLLRNSRYYADVKQSVQEMAVSLLGPLVSYMFDNVPSAYQLSQQGHYDRAFEKLFGALAKPEVAYRLSEEGAKRISGKTILHKDELTKWDIASQAIGIRPENLAVKERAGSQAEEAKLRLITTKTKLLDRIWAEHLKASPGENVARREFYKFAERHPDLVPDPEDAIDKSFENKLEGLVNAAVNYGVDIPENMMPEVAPILYGAKKFK